MMLDDDSEALTRVGPGTPMGNVMRQYWIPALKSSEIAADGDPVRFRLLCENLVAFRDSAGRVGVMDHRCPHRCASLFFGRNEEGGIRCVYHGWKFDVDGNCTDMANVPAHQDFKHKVRAKAYKTEERNGLVWVYMGDQANVPPLPALEASLLPQSAVHIAMTRRDCNYLQALEGDIDTSHFDFLHRGAVKADDFSADNPERFGALRRDPEYKVVDTDIGTMYGAYRPADGGNIYWRIAHFLFPFWTMIPNRPFDDYIVARAWVPIDDDHCMYVIIRNVKKGSDADGEHGRYLPNSTDWLGRWRLSANAANDYKIDRQAQRTSSYSGITGTNEQDQMTSESMGSILDRRFEHLAPSDKMIIQTRKRLLLAARAMAKDGVAPPGSRDADAYFNVRSGYYVAPAEADFLQTYRERLAALHHPVARRRAVAAQ